MEKNLRRAAGSLLVVGLGGTELTGLERAWLRLVRPAGVVLFKRNIADPEQTRALVDEATGLSAKHSARFVDVEGGTVNRFRDALAPMPSAQAVARADAKLGPKRRGTLAREHGELIGRAVKAFGFNTTLAPVVDLALPVSAEVMGTRAPAADPAGVVAFTAGVSCGTRCGRRCRVREAFPGTGKRRGRYAFRYTGDPAHVQGDMGRRPCSLSRTAQADANDHDESCCISARRGAGTCRRAHRRSGITTVLRKQIGYRGLILTDDLEMGGILKFMPIEEAAVTAVRAGSDLLEICHSVELILRTFEVLIAEAERSAAFNKLLLQRATEVERKRARLFRGVPKALTAKQFDTLRERVNRVPRKSGRPE